MSGFRPFPRQKTVALAVVSVVGIGAVQRATLHKEAFAESPQSSGGPACPLQARRGPGPGFGGGMGFTTLRLESSQLVNENTKRLRFQLPDPNSNAGLALTSFVLTFHKPKDAWLPVIRPYTPINSFDEPGYIDLLVKQYPNGRASTHLHSLQPGDTLNIRGPIRSYNYHANSFTHINLIAGGTGITPMYQLTQGILNNPDERSKIKLLIGVNTVGDIVLKDELDELERKFPERLSVVYTVSNGETAGEGQYEAGRITKELLARELVKGEEGTQQTKVFVCGPPAMENALLGGKGWFGGKGVLHELGFSGDEIHKF